MADMRGGMFGRKLLPTGIMGPAGRPVFIDPEGYPETEKSMTIQDPRINAGQWTNIPSIWGDEQRDDPVWAANNALVSGKEFPGYSSLDDAEREAKTRSFMLGRMMPHIPGMDYNTGRLTQTLMQQLARRGY